MKTLIRPALILILAALLLSASLLRDYETTTETQATQEDNEVVLTDSPADNNASENTQREDTHVEKETDAEEQADSELESLEHNKEVSTIKREDDVEFSKEDTSVSNNIANSILDTMFAEITDVKITTADSKGELTVNFQWKSNLEVLEDSLREAFTFKKSVRGHELGFRQAHYSVAEPRESDPAYNVFQALLENEISLIIRAGDHEESITIATGHRNKADELEYVLLPSKSDTPSTLIIEKQTLPIVISDIPFDEAKMIREVELGISLKRLDTGMTFNAMLDKKEI